MWAGRKPAHPSTMPNKRYGEFNKVGQSTTEASTGSSRKMSYKESKRNLPSMGPKRPAYESSAPKVKTYVSGDY